MKRAKLIHNPHAGDVITHSKQVLLDLIEINGFNCDYASVKNNDHWKQFSPELDFLIVAGGDGTIRKVVKELLAYPGKLLPITVLPLGTANNIAKTLGITGTLQEIILSWKHATVKKVDIGVIEGISESDFFLESFGYGTFPYLMRQMLKGEDESLGTTAEALDLAVKLMQQIVLSYEPRFCELKIDGSNHSGMFLLAEVMNTSSIGPRLVLSPDGDMTDGELEVVLIAEQQRDDFVSYVSQSTQSRKQDPYPFPTLKAKEVVIKWDGTDVHVDDTLVRVNKNAVVKISSRSGCVDFLIA